MKIVKKEKIVEETKTNLVEEAKATKEKKAVKKPVKLHGQRYLKAKQIVDRNKIYKITKAVALIKKTSFSRFEGSVEAHFVTAKQGFKGDVKFPYSVGKSQKIRIANDDLIKELEAGKIDFDTLISTPEMMPKLLKFARLLGPKGLMPNPKTGTISPNPEKIVKEMSDKIQFKTENKAPLIHIVIGKVKAEDKQLIENFQALINAIGPNNIIRASLSPTMGPGVKVEIEKVK